MQQPTIYSSGDINNARSSPCAAEGAARIVGSVCWGEREDRESRSAAAVLCLTERGKTTSIVREQRP